MRADFSIRLATPADVEPIAAIYAEAVLNGTASFEIEPPTEAEIARRMGELLAGGHPYLVAGVGGAVLGYGYVGPYRPRPAYHNTVEDSIYVGALRRGARVSAGPCLQR